MRTTDAPCDLGGVFGPNRTKVAGKSTEIASNSDGHAISHIAPRCPMLECAELHFRHDPELFVQTREGAAGQPMDAAVDGVGVARPGRADAAEREIVLDDGGLEAAGAPIAARRKPSEPTANDNYVLAHAARREHEPYLNSDRLQPAVTKTLHTSAPRRGCAPTQGVRSSFRGRPGSNAGAATAPSNR